ncbi:MAG TPA: glycosyltransferase family 2 protein, partial [Methanobacterium sp.]|nr:glycosyltransferase family 2 protein [Methanobacterium sp.]
MYFKISVIIPVYNSERYLGKCLDSIVNQTLKDIEILCIDDCSTDSTPQIIKEFSKEDNRVKYLKMIKNSGSGPARNKGLEIATGEYVSF